MLELVTAVIKPHQLEAVNEALRSSGVVGMTITEVKGFGRQGGHTETYGGVPINIDNNYLYTDPNGGDPFGQIDAVTGGPSKVTASGWAIDPDTSSAILVQMYVDGRANALTWANLPRPDIGAAFPAAGPNHGYSLTMQTTPGSHTVCLYAINNGPGTSSTLGCQVVYVP